MSKDYRLAVVVLAALFLFALPRPTLAIPATCGPNGTCMSSGNCSSLENTDHTVTNFATTDCPIYESDGITLTGNTCCTPPPPAPPAVQAATCDSVGGYCSLDCMSDDDKGSLDCPTKTGDSLQKCCKSKTSVPATPGNAVTPGTTPAGTAPVASAPLGIIPADVAGCIKTGDCSLDQIVRTGVGFADFLMGLSGALFLAIFVYGGALYLLSFGDKTKVQKGTDAIKGAAIGIVIVMAAWTIVGLIVSGIGANTGTTTTGGKTGSISATACTDLGAAWTCKTFDGSTTAQVMQTASKSGYTCQSNKCQPASDIHVICCKAK